MSLPKKGTRSIVVGGAAYRWHVGYDGLHWDKGYLTQLSFTVQATASASPCSAQAPAATPRWGSFPLSSTS